MLLMVYIQPSAAAEAADDNTDVHASVGSTSANVMNENIAITTMLRVMMHYGFDKSPLMDDSAAITCMAAIPAHAFT
jgi:hypothetical protein